jgi:hypothetical protein
MVRTLAQPSHPDGGEMLIDPKELVDRYVAVWNQPDAERRRKAITQLWTEDGVQHLQPPQEVREAATRLGLTPTLEARGHDELGVRGDPLV